jgi:hypothetical protein
VADSGGSQVAVRVPRLLVALKETYEDNDRIIDDDKVPGEMLVLEAG